MQTGGEELIAYVVDELVYRLSLGVVGKAASPLRTGNTHRVDLPDASGKRGTNCRLASPALHRSGSLLP